VTSIQAETEGLPPGRLIQLRGLDGVRSDAGPYSAERGFTFALSPGRKELAASLEWVDLTEGS
jgi:hypothetical protein